MVKNYSSKKFLALALWMVQFYAGSALDWY